MKKLFNKVLKILILSCFAYISCYSQKQIAITIDDPNTYGTVLLNWQDRNKSILNTLEKHKIKAALFVCGMRLNDSNGIELLQKWDEKNHLICNHSYSHRYYNSPSLTSDLFISDYKKCDSVIKKSKNYTKFFRFPFLKEGDTKEKRDAMRMQLEKDGYKNGHVSIDASDWYIDSEIAKVLKDDINSNLEPYKEYYIKHILERAKYYDSLANLIFKKQIKHTLLVHHSLLNALFLDDLLFALKKNGWQIIDAQVAYEDKIFDLKPEIEPCGESIVWQCASLDSNLAKYLRYPAEDAAYEKDSLQYFLKSYNLKKR